ncbi:hypothetical protein [Nostocoides sp. HKS02]|uniref:hypothetical protein n=1 Tax=Nostocoides sp. HKS02 TaxID=1813880 RepID=UPI00351BC524
MAPYLDERRIDSEEVIATLDSRQTLRGLATAGAQVREAIDLSVDAGIERVSGGSARGRCWSPRSVAPQSSATSSSCSPSLARRCR